MSQLQNKFNENFWSSHFNAQSKSVIDDAQKLVPVNQKGGGDFVKVVSPLTNSGLITSDSIVGKKRKRSASKKPSKAKKRKVSKKRTVSKKKKAKPKRKTGGRKKASKGKKKTATKKKAKTKSKSRRSGKTKRR